MNVYSAVKSFLKSNIARQIGFAFFILFVSRLVWFLANLFWLPSLDTFSYVEAFLWGFYFDLPVIAYLFAPLFFYQLAFPTFSQKYQIVTRILFLIPNAICLIFNGIDTGFSKINGKRSGFDFFSLAGDDANNIAPYLIDNIPSLIGLATAFFIIYKFTPVNGNAIHLWKKNRIFRSILSITLTFILWILAARGGTQLRPLRSIDASNYVDASISAVVYSTPLNILSTWNREGKFYKPIPFPITKAESILGLTSKQTTDVCQNRKNIVVLVVESLARDYTGFLNQAPYTPFLDSLAKHSLNFTHCFANGTKSIDMVPAIFAGLPNLMDEPYILSTYNTNTIENAFSKHKKFGYSTGFFHGSNNGTMGFKSFLMQTGIDHYFGIDEYPTTDKDFDGNWGIWDEPYLQYIANCLDTMKKPFFNAVFTLSSHHPYEIPKKYEKALPFQEKTIQRSIGYTDIALKNFFRYAATKSWFKNTVFVITGDHTSHGVLEYFYCPSGRYEVPFLIYNSGIVPQKFNKSLSQCDILPTLSGVLGNKIHYSGLGRNALDSAYEGYSMHYDKGLYYMIQYPFAMAMNEFGEVKVFQKQIRNQPKPTILPRNGLTYNEMKATLNAYLYVFTERLKSNKWR